MVQDAMIEISIARLEEQMKSLTRALERLEHELTDTRTQVIELRDIATRGRMILIVLATIGTVFGWVVAQTKGILGFIGLER